MARGCPVLRPVVTNRNDGIPAMRNIYSTYNVSVWGPYGFSDGFNLSKGWWDTDHIGIDQGPIVLMIENYLNGRVWERMMKNADLLRGLQLAGFNAVVSVDGGPLASDRTDRLFPSEPNPVQGAATLRFRLGAAGRVRLAVFDLQGREVARLLDEERPAGLQAVTLPGRTLPRGVYHARLEHNGRTQVVRFVRLD